MSKDLGNYRKSYLKGVLNEKDLPLDPLELFNSWFSNVDSKKSEIEQFQGFKTVFSTNLKFWRPFSFNPSR